MSNNNNSGTPAPNIRFGSAARRLLSRGARTAADVIGITLGPSGRNVIYDRPWSTPVSTHDGVTVAREIAFSNRHLHMGAMLTLEAARRTVMSAGDGTTATAVLVGELVARGQKLVATGYDPMALARGMQFACSLVVDEVRKMVRPVDASSELERVAMIASGDDEEIAAAVVEAIETVGLRGMVSIERSRRAEAITLDMSNGLWFDRGWTTSSLLDEDEAANGRIEIDRPLVLLLDDPVFYAPAVVSLLEAALRTVKGWNAGAQGVPPSGLVIVGDVQGDALATVVQNRKNGLLNAIVVRPPWAAGGSTAGGSTVGGSTSRIEALEDVAAATGAGVLGMRTGRMIAIEMSEAGVKVGIESLGMASHVEVTTSRTLLELSPVGLHGEDLEARATARLDHIEAMRQRAMAAGQGHTVDLLTVRAARLGGGACTIRVGGATETEASERAFRVEDALCATRVAILDGVVPGAGASLVFGAKRAAETYAGCKGTRDSTSFSLSQDERAGAELLLAACTAPFVRLADNAGESGVSLARKLMARGDCNLTWNARRSINVVDPTDDFVDAWESGIVDPVRVPVCILQHAVSSASMLLTVEVSLHPLRSRDVG